MGLYLSVLAELQWPYAIMENVTGLLAGGCARVCLLGRRPGNLPASIHLPRHRRIARQSRCLRGAALMA